MTKSTKRNIFWVLMMAVMIVTAFWIMGTAIDGDSAYAADSKKIVVSQENVITGIRVSWTADKDCTGYYIYRKAGGSSSKWVMVKNIKSKDKVKWLDKDVKNGVRYLYKVKSYSGSEVLKTSKYVTGYRLNRPEIKKINAGLIGKIYMRGTKNSKATGFQIQYAYNKFFYEAKTINIAGNKLQKSVPGFIGGKKYYVRIRAYMEKNGKTYYSNWSKRKSVKTKDPYNAYTVSNWTYFFTKPNANSSSIRLWYNTEVKVLGIETESTAGNWYRIEYSGKQYFIWMPAGENRLTKTRNSYDYVRNSNTKFENEIIEKAMYCFNNWDMKYDYTHRAEHGVPDTDGKYPFDCSNFAAYVYNSVMQQYCPVFKISESVLIQSQMDTFLNEGLPGEVNAIRISDGKLDRTQLRPGDLLYFKTDSTDERIADHVGIYLGGDDMIHSVKMYQRYPGDPLGGVCIAPLTGDNELTFMYALRLLPNEVISAETEMTATEAVNIYPDVNCKNGTKIDQLPEGSKLTVMYTLNREYNDSDGDIASVVIAYVRYGDNKYGFVYASDEKLELV